MTDNITTNGTYLYVIGANRHVFRFNLDWSDV